MVTTIGVWVFAWIGFKVSVCRIKTHYTRLRTWLWEIDRYAGCISLFNCPYVRWTRCTWILHAGNCVAEFVNETCTVYIGFILCVWYTICIRICLVESSTPARMARLRPRPPTCHISCDVCEKASLGEQSVQVYPRCLKGLWLGSGSGIRIHFRLEAKPECDVAPGF